MYVCVPCANASLRLAAVSGLASAIIEVLGAKPFGLTARKAVMAIAIPQWFIKASTLTDDFAVQAPTPA